MDEINDIYQLKQNIKKLNLNELYKLSTDLIEMEIDMIDKFTQKKKKLRKMLIFVIRLIHEKKNQEVILSDTSSESSESSDDDSSIKTGDIKLLSEDSDEDITLTEIS